MRMEKLLLEKIQENAQDLKDKLTENDLYLLYWYIAECSDEMSSDELDLLYEVVKMLEEKYIDNE